MEEQEIRDRIQDRIDSYKSEIEENEKLMNEFPEEMYNVLDIRVDVQKECIKYLEEIIEEFFD